MKLIIYFIIANLLFINSLVADSKLIAIVDLQKVLDQSLVGKNSKSVLDKKLKEDKANFEKEKLVFTKSRNDLIKQKALLSKDAFEKKQIELINKEREFQRKITDAQEALQRQTFNTIDRITKEVLKIAKEVADDNGYKFVFEKDSRFVVYADDSIDISTEVIKLLNQKNIKI
jgi:outer membrane protein